MADMIGTTTEVAIEMTAIVKGIAVVVALVLDTINVILGLGMRVTGKRFRCV